MIQRDVKYLLDTKLYEMLKEKFEVILLVGIPYDRDFEKSYGGDHVSIVNINVDNAKPVPGAVQKVFMKYLLFHLDFMLGDQEIGRFNQSIKKKIYPRQYKICKTIYKFSPLFMAGPVFSRLAGRLFKHKKIEEIVGRHRPDLVISTTPAKLFIEYCLHRAAKKEGIPLVFYPSSWDDFTRSGIFPFAPDKVLSWGPEMSRHAVEFLGLPKSGIVDVGQVRMEASREIKASQSALRRHFDIPEDHKVILVATNRPHMGLALPRIIAELLEDMEAGRLGKAVLLLRPNNTRPENQRVYIERFKDHPLVRINLPESDGDESWRGQASLQWREIISSVDVVVTVCSMMILEAFHYDVPVVNPNYNYGMLNQYGLDYVFNYDREVFQSISRMGGTTMADDREGLVKALKAYLEDPALHQDRRERVMEQWDARPAPPDTRSATALRALEGSLA
ncbi:MAG: hypothetical protein KKC30_13090 [Proteobacteria bacterium]|nr:hypothetical protein [Pseudomonadota bacterium]MBU4384643.1 hypothetical protein [Pseudomonadota bacterium]MCG2766209.1 hypothetical protein [Desulfarculaceae bacterium]